MMARKQFARLLSLTVFLTVAAVRGASAQPAPLTLPLPGAPAAKASAPSPRWLHKSQNGTLLVRSKTTGAAIFVDGLEVGRVPVGPLKVAPGPHLVKLSLPGYKPQTQRVEVVPAQQSVVASELKAVRGVAEVGAPILGAKVLVDGKPVGVAPLHDLELAPGKRVLSLVAPGAARVEQTLTVRAGEHYKVFGGAGANDEPAPPLLALPLPPAPARIAVANPAPPALTALIAEPPPPALDLDAPPPLITSTGEFASAAKPALVPAAALPGPSSPDLAREPITRKWWFWGGAAVVATAVLAGVVYALPAQYVERRDPSAACGGTCGIVVNK